MRRLIHEASNHKIVLLTKIRTKKKLEQALELSKKNSDDEFEDVDKLEGKVKNSIKSHPKSVRT